MSCDRCDAPAMYHMDYAGAHLCADHLRRSVEKRVRRRVRSDALIPDAATPDDPVTWVIGLSGGKDSAVLAHILSTTLREDPRVALHGVALHEGIAGYRDESVDAARTLADRLDLPLTVRSYPEEFGLAMDDVAADEAAEMASCAYCGVFRRDLLDRVADELGADLLLTGHNLDDEAQTAMMNFLGGDVDQMAKHYRASLAPLPDRPPMDAFVPRAKPLRDVPEREVALYATSAALPAHIAECPHASEAFRGEIQSMLFDLEERHPGTRQSIMAGYEAMAEALATGTSFDPDDALRPCTVCGSMTTGETCRSCQLVEEVG